MTTKAKAPAAAPQPRQGALRTIARLLLGLRENKRPVYKRDGDLRR